MSEYKEWALAEGYVPQKLDNVYGFDEAKEYFNKYELVNPIHVIEYAAFENLKKQNEIMREALEFYAKEMNYSVDDYRGISGEMINRCILYTDCEERNDVYSYAGKRARQALKDVEGLG